MWKTTYKSLLAHKLRLSLTALSVVLGVAFMAGTFVLTDTLKHTFDSLFAQTSVGKDAVVRAVAPYGTGGLDSGASGVRPLTPESVLTTVRSTPGVGVAEGAVTGLVTVIGKNGKALKKQAPTLGFNWFSARQLSALSLRSGRGPVNSSEFTIDSGTAKSEHFALGDKVTIITNQPPEQFTLVGITGFGKADNLAGATLVTFETATAQHLFGTPGYFAEIDVAAAPGTTPTQLISNISGQLPHGFEAVSSAAVAKEQANNVEQFVGIFNTILLVFAGIALFVGAFLIFNTFSILVGQRTRELALLRAIGASRRQVNTSVMAEAVFVGLFGSVIGLAIGVPLAAGLYGLLDALGLSLPSSALQLLPRTIIVSLVVGTMVTVVSAVLPAYHASKVAPVAAMRDDPAQAPTSLRRRAIVGGAVLALGLVLLAGGLFAHAGLAAVGAGAAITFLGVAILAPFVTSPLARVLGAPLPNITGHLARRTRPAILGGRRPPPRRSWWGWPWWPPSPPSAPRRWRRSTAFSTRPSPPTTCWSARAAPVPPSHPRSSRWPRRRRAWSPSARCGPSRSTRGAPPAW